MQICNTCKPYFAPRHQTKIKFIAKETKSQPHSYATLTSPQQGLPARNHCYNLVCVSLSLPKARLLRWLTRLALDQLWTMCSSSVMVCGPGSCFCVLDTAMCRHCTHCSAFLPSLALRTYDWSLVKISKALGMSRIPLRTAFTLWILLMGKVSFFCKSDQPWKSLVM